MYIESETKFQKVKTIHVGQTFHSRPLVSRYIVFPGTTRAIISDNFCIVFYYLSYIHLPGVAIGAVFNRILLYLIHVCILYTC